MHYLRFKRDYSLIATEVGKKKKNFADVLATNFKEIVEIEVKISSSDLNNDFKKEKHARYANPRTQYTPNKFYFAVPEHLKDKALDLTKGTSYGVMIVSEKPLKGFTKESYISIAKNAIKLKDRYCRKLEKEILMRSTSELIRLRIKYL